MLKLFRILTLLLIILFSANSLIASNENTIDNNRYLYGLFKNFYFSEIDSFQAKESEIQEAFIQLYNYDKFDLNFKIYFYFTFFKKHNNEFFTSLTNSEIVVLIVNALKNDAETETKIYSNNFSRFYIDKVGFIVKSFKNNCKINFVKDKDEMLLKEMTDKEDKYFYVPQECYKEVEKFVINNE